MNTDPSGLFSLTETQANLYLILTLANTVQATYGAFLRKVQGEVNWNGYSGNISYAIPGSGPTSSAGVTALGSFGGFGFLLESDSIEGHKTKGAWIAIGYGGAVGVEGVPPGDFGGSIGLAPFGGYPTTVVAPKIYGGNVWTLAGGFLFGELNVGIPIPPLKNIGPGTGWSTFTMGFGVGQASLVPGLSVGKGTGLAFSSGFTIPIYSKTDP